MLAVRAAGLLMAAMMAGGLTMVMVAVVPTFRRLPDRLAVGLHREVDRYVDVPLPIFTALTFLSSVVLLFDGTTVLVAAAAACAIAVAVGSHFVNRPMNLRLKSWGSGPVPAEYARLRRRWDMAHAIRTAAGVAALICLIVAMLETGA
jgi:Domain of unknown function (DUF1772)